jgi:hypothetical protein
VDQSAIIIPPGISVSLDGWSLTEVVF